MRGQHNFSTRRVMRASTLSRLSVGELCAARTLGRAFRSAWSRRCNDGAPDAGTLLGVRDYRRNGWYALAGALTGGSAAWMVGWGITVASAKKDSGTRFLTIPTYGAFATCVLGLLIIFAVIFDWPSKLRRRNEPADDSTPPTAPLATGWGGVSGFDPAVWKGTVSESGDHRTLAFLLDHLFGERLAAQTFTLLRVTVTDPGCITTSAEGTGRIYQYPGQFPPAPAVGPGTYHFRWEGRDDHGGWHTITQGDHDVLAPAPTGLEVMIDNEVRTPFPGTGLILEIEFHVTNHDPVPHDLRQSMTGWSLIPLPPMDDPERIRMLHAYGAISERRRAEQLPPRVRAGEMVRAVYVKEFSWDPSGRLPDYTLIISDGRRDYRARPVGAEEGGDALATRP